MKSNHTPLDRLKHHVTGAIERGEKTAIVGQPTTELQQVAQKDIASRVAKLSRPSRWLLKHLAESEHGVCSTVGLPCFDYKDQPRMVNMNGLLKRGWAEEKFPGCYYVTSAGKFAARSLSKSQN